MSRSEDLFAAEKRPITFSELLNQAQQYLSTNYPKLLADKNSNQKKEKMLSYLRKFISDKSYAVRGIDSESLPLRLYQEMAEYSFLTPYFYNSKKNNIEGIEINAWDDITVKYAGGLQEKSAQHFQSPQQAKDIFNRLLRNSGYPPMDDAKPIARGHLGSNIRITVDSGGGTLDNDVGLCASIRFINPNGLTKRDLVSNGTLTEEMMDLLCGIYRYGRSMLLAGETDAGKTTLMSVIMSEAVPYGKKLITIEYGDREFNLVVSKDGKILNNVIHLRTKDSEDIKLVVTPQMLLEFSMTMNPDFLCMAEIRGAEAFETIEAALTGHPVIGTVHVDCCEDIPDRLVQLASIKCSNLSDTTLYRMVTKAFPILFYEQKMEDSKRRVTDICECFMEGDKLVFNPLWVFESEYNEEKEGKTIIHGQFKKSGTISAGLQRRLRRKGMPETMLKKITGGDGT